MKKTILATAIGLMLSSTLVLAAETQQPSGVVMLPETKTQPQQPTQNKVETEQKPTVETPKFDLIKRKQEIKSLVEQNKITTKPELLYYLDKQDNGVIFNIDQKIAEQKLQFLKDVQELSVDKDKKVAELKQKRNEIDSQINQIENENTLRFSILKSQNEINENFMSKVKDATKTDLENERRFILNYSENALKIK